jgi:hypothetical protein
MAYMDGASSTLCGKALNEGLQFINPNVSKPLVGGESFPGSSIQLYVCGRYLTKPPH